MSKRRASTPPIDLRLYSAIHSWLKYYHGKANRCEHVETCTKKSLVFEWAKIREKEYDFNRDNFIQLCRSCHVRYDLTPEGREKLRKAMEGWRPSPEMIAKAREAKLGKPLSEETRKKISEAHKGVKLSAEHARRAYEKNVNRLKTQCKYGHEFTTENTRIRPNGHRSCRTCLRALNRKYKAQKALLEGTEESPPSP